ncbi:MAG: hypothetical protein ACYC6N_09145, partial [Pirellulaceae bacterium]
RLKTALTSYRSRSSCPPRAPEERRDTRDERDRKKIEIAFTTAFRILSIPFILSTARAGGKTGYTG